MVLNHQKYLPMHLVVALAENYLHHLHFEGEYLTFALHHLGFPWYNDLARFDLAIYEYVSDLQYRLELPS